MKLKLKVAFVVFAITFWGQNAIAKNKNNNLPNENASGFYENALDKINEKCNNANFCNQENNQNSASLSVSLVEIASLSFGEIVVGNAPSVIEIVASGSGIVKMGNAIVLDGMQGGRLQASGKGGDSISISAPSTIILTNEKGNELVFEPKLSQNQIFIAKDGDAYNIDILGNLHLNAGQPSGSYSGNFYLFANY